MSASGQSRHAASFSEAGSAISTAAFEGRRAGTQTQLPAWPALLVGSVRHTRTRPVWHSFRYPTFCVLLPMRAWGEQRVAPALARNRFAWMSFFDRDHGDGRGDALAWLQGLLSSHGVAGVDGEVWLQTYPRILGFVFKPVSFWYCHGSDGQLRAIVAEVNNTFGERHCYLLTGPQLAWGREIQADKVFHVSPFFGVRGRYRFRFVHQPPADSTTSVNAAHPATSEAAASGTTRAAASTAPQPAAGALGSAGRLVARVDYGDERGPLLFTSLAGELQPLDRRHAAAALARMPLLTIGVLARIHWQAVKLYVKRVPFFRKPAPPAAAVSSISPHPLSSVATAMEPVQPPPRIA